MKHNLCVKISYKKYLLANTSFPPPVVLQYTSGRSEKPAARMGDCNLHTGYLFLKPCKGRKSLQPECGIATAMKRLHPFKRYWRSEEPAARMRDCNFDVYGHDTSTYRSEEPAARMRDCNYMVFVV